MLRKLVIVSAIVAVLALPAAAVAHKGHAHKVMGTVSRIDGNHLAVKTTDGKTVMVMVDAKTKITQGKATLTSTALKVGDRVVAEGPLEKDMLTAASLQVGAVPAAAPKK